MLSSQIREMFKYAYYRNHCIDFSQILHNNKDHQMLIASGPNTHTISKMVDGRYIEKDKSPYLGNCLTDRHEIGMVTHFDFLRPISHDIENRKNSISR